MISRVDQRLLRYLPVGFALAFTLTAQATILWSDLGETLAHNTGDGSDILGGAVKRDDDSSDVLYFKVHVDPLSDISTEEYFAGFELFEGDVRRLAIGNATKAWAYSAFHTSEKGEFNKYSGDYDLHSSRPESTFVGVYKRYEQPRRGIARTIVFRVQYIPNDDDQVTVWLSPDLTAGGTETNQLENLTTQFKANCSFDEIHLRHGGGGDGWTFSDMAIATAFSDFVSGHQVTGNKSAPVGRSALSYRFRSWQAEQGLTQGSIRTIAQSKDGYLWLGTGSGLMRFDGVRFVPMGEHNGLRFPISAMLFDDYGALWVGGVTNGLFRWRDGKTIAFTAKEGLPSNAVTALAQDRHRQLWIGTAGGLVMRKGEATVPVPNAAGLAGKAIAALFRDHHGAMWAAARGAGVFQFQSNRWNQVTDASLGKLLEDAHCLLVDQRNRLWVGAGDDFVLCRDGGQWSRYRIPRHLDKPMVTALAETADGTVWAGSGGEGVFEFKDSKIKAINAGNGLLDNFVQSLFVDREANVWVGAQAGLNQLRPKTAPPEQEEAHVPTVILEEVLMDGEPVAFDARPNATPTLRVPPGRHRLEFRYTGLSFAAPERIRFRYRVAGLDPGWIDAANRRSAFYSYVAPGRFEFEVTACNTDGVWNEVPARLAFAVLPHFWQTWWFYGGAIVTVFLGVGGTIRFLEKRKVQRRLEQLEHERTLERERARIAQDLHDDLGASLSRISLLSDMARAGQGGVAPGGEHVDKISQLAGQTLRALDQIVWAVRPGSDTLQSVVDYIAHFANELFKGTGVRCRLDLPEELPARQLPPEMRHNIFLIAKEALTNAFKHSFAREISIQIRATSDSLAVLIQDDGSGFDPDAEPGERDGNGLENMRQRAAAIGAQLQIASAPGKGTTIRLAVDFSRNGHAAAVSRTTRSLH
jgi:signal transduction histidine kinase